MVKVRDNCSFVDIGETVNHHHLNFLFTISTFSCTNASNIFRFLERGVRTDNTMAKRTNNDQQNIHIQIE